MELEEAGASDEVEEEPAKYEVEKIVRHEKKKGVYKYICKWVDWESKYNTREPEENLLTCQALPAYWKAKKNKVGLSISNK